MKIWQSYVSMSWDRRVIVGAALLASIPVLLTYVFASAAPPEPVVKAALAVDTHIPRGFVLVPIDVQNYESLDSVLGSYGIVDLYQATPSGSSDQRLVARNVRLLRAPQNPSHFAVLVPEAEARHVLRGGGTFTVIVKRPGENGTEIVKERTISKRKIIYEGS